MKKIILLLIIPILFFCCDKDDALDAGIQTKVYGNIYDIPNDIPFVNLKLKIAEYKTVAQGLGTSYEFIKYVDSTLTDSEGNYDFTFRTSGLGDYYRLFVVEDIDIWTYQYDAVPIYNIGGENNWDLDFLHLYPVNLIITLNNMEYTPVYVNAFIFPFIEEIEIANGEVNRILYTDKNTDTPINFRRVISYSIQEDYPVTVPASNTTETVNFSINIENSDFN